MVVDNRLASFITAKVDPATGWEGAPPNFGKDVIPHVFTVAGQVGLSGSAYLNADEALRHDPENAERMKADCGITECLESRQRACTLLDWKIEPEQDDESLEAKELARLMSRIIRRTPRMTELLRCTTEAIWSGKSGVAMQYASDDVGGDRRIVCNYWEPRHGDKLVFRFDDGTGKHNPKQVGIRVGVGALGSHYNREQIEYTQQGMVYWLNDWERRLFIVHKHMIEDGPHEKPELAGRIHGVGVRSKIYWTWYAMVECLQRALEYLDRSAMGVELWRFPANNTAAEAKTAAAAKRHVGGGRSIVMVPVWPGDQADMYGVEHIEPGLAGVDRLLTVIKEFFQHKMKRYILGQILTSEAEATGLGSGVADAHLQTFSDIVEYDAKNLEETVSTDYLRPVQLFNFPQSRRILLRFRLMTEGDKAKEKLALIKESWDMGMPIRESDIATASGLVLPKPGERFVCNPQIYGAIQQFQTPINNPNEQMEKHSTAMANSIMNALGIPSVASNIPTDDLSIQEKYLTTRP